MYIFKKPFDIGLKKRCSVHRKTVAMIGVCLLLMSACKQENLRRPLSDDGTPPGPVTNVTVESLHGGAKISYTKPEDIDLLYVQASYEIRKGVKEESQGSSYDNSLLIQGFGDTTEHRVDIYAVDRSGNKSESVTVMVKPLISPVQQAYDSLFYFADFGGIHVQFRNETMSNIVTSVMIKDAFGDWIDYDKDYTSLPYGDFSVRGLPAAPTTFGVYVKDRWDNRSDTLVQELTPLFEMKLDKSKFKEVPLPSDIVSVWTFANFWNDIPTKGSKGAGIRPPANQGFPAWFTFSLGIKAKLSRFRLWGVHDGREYSSSNVKQFQVWGSNAPNPDGSWDESWTLLQNYEVVKPSGLPDGELSNEDIATAAAGDEFAVPSDAPAVKYIRFKIISTFGNPPNSTTGEFWLTETTFWGQEEP